MEEGTQVPQRRADTVCVGGGGGVSGEQEADRKKLCQPETGQSLGSQPGDQPKRCPQPREDLLDPTEAGQRLLQTTPPPRSPHRRTKSLSPQRRYLSMLTIIPRNNH